MVVPKLVNVYNDHGTVSLLFEPPHHSFWKYASADMPYVLKKQVVQAYLALHLRGILHGSSDLHNILITGDCQVRLIDFSRARARLPTPAVGIGKAHKRDFEYEMREVMFKLDYEGARRREGARMDRVEDMRKRNKARQELRDLQKKGIVDSPVEPDEWLTQADHSEFPLHPLEYNLWVKSLEIPPIPRIVVPGQSEEQLGAAEEEFNACLKRLEEQHGVEATAPLLLRSDDYPLPLPLRILSRERILAESLASNRKRKASSEEPEEHRAAKRPRMADNSDPEPAPVPVVYECTCSYILAYILSLIFDLQTHRSRSLPGRPTSCFQPRHRQSHHPPSSRRSRSGISLPNLTMDLAASTSHIHQTST